MIVVILRENGSNYFQAVVHCAVAFASDKLNLQKYKIDIDYVSLDILDKVCAQYPHKKYPPLACHTLLPVLIGGNSF
jgi:hypothetical protein